MQQTLKNEQNFENVHNIRNLKKNKNRWKQKKLRVFARPLQNVVALEDSPLAQENLRFKAENTVREQYKIAAAGPKGN